MLSDAVARLTPTTASAEHKRGIKRFALLEVAGRLGVLRDVFDCQVSEVEAAVKTTLRTWLFDNANLPDRVRGVISVAQFIAHHEERFQPPGDDNAVPPRVRVGYVGYDDPAKGRAYLFTHDGLTEACGDLDVKHAARELQRIGEVVAREHGRFTEKREIRGLRQRLYIVKAIVLEIDPAANLSNIASGATSARV